MRTVGRTIVGCDGAPTVRRLFRAKSLLLLGFSEAADGADDAGDRILTFSGTNVV
jgi:hypothetical protein